MRYSLGLVSGQRNLWWFGLPLVPAQAIWLSRTMQRFPDADGLTGQVGSGERRMKVVALGDSVAAGYAVDHHRSTVAGELAARMATAYDATVDWQVLAVSGYTAGEALTLIDSASLGDADLVFLSVGVNDMKDLHTAKRFRRELEQLLDAEVSSLAPPPRKTVDATMLDRRQHGLWGGHHAALFHFHGLSAPHLPLDHDPRAAIPGLGGPRRIHR